MASVFKTARVPAAYIRVGHVVPTLSDTLAHSLDAPFGVVQTYVEEPGEEQSFERSSDSLSLSIPLRGWFRWQSSPRCECTPRSGEAPLSPLRVLPVAAFPD